MFMTQKKRYTTPTSCSLAQVAIWMKLTDSCALLFLLVTPCRHSCTADVFIVLLRRCRWL